MVASRREHPAAAVDHALRRLGRATGCTPPLSVFRGGSGYTVHGLFDARVIELQRNAIAQRQVARSDKQEIEARHCGDLVDTLHGLAIFDLQRKKDFSIRMLDMFASVRKSPVGVRARAVQSARGQAEGNEPNPPTAGPLRRYGSAGP